MAYINNQDITSIISGFELPGFTDDGQTGQLNQGVLDIVFEAASNAADAYVASIYTTPFTTYVPAKIKDATLVFAAEMLYQRRLSPDEKNPFKARADFYRKLLEQIGAGEIPLDVNVPRAFQPGVAIISNSRANPDPRANPANDEPSWV